MKAELIAMLLLAAPFPAAAEESGQTLQRLDVSGITEIKVTGDASFIELTTEEDAPYEATFGNRRTGLFSRWYSSWFYTDCRTTSRMRIEKSTLYVDVEASSWLEAPNCTTELKANVRKDTVVSIEQAASQVKMAGDFSAITLDNKAADFTFDGYATTVRLNGKAMRSHLTFDRTRQSETIAITAQSLDTYIGFATKTPISYEVNAVASMVDSSLPNTPGAKPSITIKGDYVRATIR